MNPCKGKKRGDFGHRQSDLNLSYEREDDETSSRPKNNAMDFIEIHRSSDVLLDYGRPGVPV